MFTTAEEQHAISSHDCGRAFPNWLDRWANKAYYAVQVPQHAVVWELLSSKADATIAVLPRCPSEDIFAEGCELSDPTSSACNMR